MAQIIPLKKQKFDFEEIIKFITDLCKEDLNSINRLIVEKIDSSVPLIQEISKYLILSGGKRLRPLLTISCFHLCDRGKITTYNHIGLAAAVEFIHAATLLHDDVVDLSRDRRGKLTANEVWGNKTSVLVGDFLFSRSFQLMTKYGNLNILKILSDTSVFISEGEVLEISNDKNLKMNEDTYFKIVNGKTASLFSAACQVGGISANIEENEIEVLKSFGTNFGMCFQLIDDALDYISTTKTMGKNLGDDFKEGKITLPVILAYGRSNNEEKKFWEKTISKLNQNPDDLLKAINIINKYNCSQDTIKRAKHFANVAIDSLSIFENNLYKESLIKLIKYSIGRLN